MTIDEAIRQARFEAEGTIVPGYDKNVQYYTSEHMTKLRHILSVRHVCNVLFKLAFLVVLIIVLRHGIIYLQTAVDNGYIYKFGQPYASEFDTEYDNLVDCGIDLRSVPMDYAPPITIDSPNVSSITNIAVQSGIDSIMGQFDSLIREQQDASNEYAN